MGENVISTKTPGVPLEGIQDQYAGKASELYAVFIGDKNSRTQNYKNFLVGLLREKGCKRILDSSCGTGIDSIMLLEEGFEVVSSDASDKMLKYALESRWNRRKEPAFDKWIIREANWVTLYDDIEDLVGDGFDAVICLGSSFAHLLDNYGDQRQHIQAIKNFEKCVKPGGILLIDHRNYDHLLETGKTGSSSIYYNPTHTTDIKTSVLYVSGEPALITRDYVIKLPSHNDTENKEDNVGEFRLSFYPHRLKKFRAMLEDAFGKRSKYTIYGDFKPLNEIKNPDYYIHLVEKPAK